MAHHDGWYGEFDKTYIDKLMEWGQKSAQKRLDQICENIIYGYFFLQSGARCGQCLCAPSFYERKVIWGMIY
jgi:hypothetical protein